MEILRKSVFLTLMAFAASVAFADAKNVCIPFSTLGPDKYLDGTDVKQGEWYALCWSDTGSDLKINADFTPYTGSEIVLSAPLAKVKDGNAYCPTTIFQIDSNDVKTSGTYSFCLLDTRGADGLPYSGTGKPTIINGFLVVDNPAIEASSGLSLSSTGNETDSANYAETEVPVGVGDPKIESFTIRDDEACFKVSNLSGALRYNVISGSELGNLNSLVNPFTGVDGTAEFRISATDAKFFKIVRQPLTEKAE